MEESNFIAFEKVIIQLAKIEKTFRVFIFLFLVLILLGVVSVQTYLPAIFASLPFKFSIVLVIIFTLFFYNYFKNNFFIITKKSQELFVEHFLVDIFNKDLKAIEDYLSTKALTPKQMTIALRHYEYFCTINNNSINEGEVS